ncbi:MAG: helix-turn-helix transcriptional regulator [Candidatus Woesearchaeota archaeon]
MNRLVYHKQKIEKHNIERLVSISTFLKEYRLQTGLSREEFSRLYGFSRITLQNAETGKNITLLTLFRIIDLLSCPLNELFYDME